MPRLYLASNNRHKAAELQQLLGALKPAWTVALARDLDPAIAWDESGDTFLANARIKAEAVRATGAALVLSTDGGCLLNLGGTLARQCPGPAAVHIAQFLRERSHGR